MVKFWFVGEEWKHPLVSLPAFCTVSSSYHFTQFLSSSVSVCPSLDLCFRYSSSKGHNCTSLFFQGMLCGLKKLLCPSGYWHRLLKTFVSHCFNLGLWFQVYRRMIKCCSYLQCHTQVAVLCQFLDETDYSAAFKALQERNVYDAMDAYYCCIWDITILEFLVRILLVKLVCMMRASIFVVR